MKHLKMIVLLATLGSLLSACGGNEAFQSVASPHQENVIQTGCSTDPVIYELITNIVDFELTDSGGFNLGFNAGGVLKLLNLNFSAKSGYTQFHMTMTDSMSQYAIADELGNGNWSSDSGAFNFNFGQYGAGFNYASTTPLANMTLAGLQSTLKEVNAELQRHNQTWQTRVTQVETDGSIMLGVGWDAGIQVGDQFAIYNVKPEWSGSTCISVKQTATPTAIASVQDSSDFSADGTSVVLTVAGQANSAVQAGALVYIQKLAGKKRALSLPLRVNTVTSPGLQLVNGQNVNLAQIANQQIGPVISHAGFYAHP